MKNQSRTIVLAAAQTGGHLLPAVETARVIREMGFATVMVTSGQAIEKEILKNSGMEVRTLHVQKINRMGVSGLVKGALSIPGALLASATMLREIRPAAVAGFGGFTSGPLVLAAQMMLIPTAVFEANSVPGITNRILARSARRVFVTFPSAGSRMGRKDFEVTGNPVRREILVHQRPEPAGPASRILVVGGSQGSRFLNQNVPKVAALLKDRIDGLVLRHQCGIGNSNAVAAEYRAAGVEAQATDYIHDMAEAMSWADFIICRSGAGTVGEVTAVGIPALFVPFALASDDHQAHNAMDLVRAGASLMKRESEFDPASVAAELAVIMRDPERLRAMSSAALAAGRRDAAQRIARGIVSMVKA
ncbi:MAG TPA: undecaprenyldiphospho-muramoylpentapeptide beta-N-acetylglucosaminyltransferase [Myxococcota bacterium]|nr:undecaprenyldiphospho-muramoylpentapeptide beta-N-acetylglucosaminyltransferase [Myxococcota bacterium]